MALLLAVVLSTRPTPAGAAAGPFIWDQDQDRIDDRVESVHLLGYSFSFEQQDTLQRQRIAVERLAGSLIYGVYVVFDHDPSAADFVALTTLGMLVRQRIEYVPAARCLATYAQIDTAAALPGVERVEAVPIAYPSARDGAAAIGVRDATDQVFPTWAAARPEDGHGVVIAFLDTGVNDEPDGSYPGHESLVGRCLGGAEFLYGDSLLDTPKQGSVNPVDRGGPATSAHGTHVAAIALGTGGPSGYVRGVAPGARFVDVKVLSDAGSGTGVPEALDWCIATGNRDSGSPDQDERGIDVINLSLSSLDESDGNDLASRLAARAAELGIVVVASMGNEAAVGEAPSPASGDGVLAVGAWDVNRTGKADDDLYAAFNTYGPRAGDGDVDAFDEQKPDLLAPGVAVMSADGNLTGDGTRYRRASGTSMAAAFVSGAVALLRSADPSLSPSEVAALLRATARRDLSGLPSGDSGADPRWYAPRGYGVIDVYAALIEWSQPEHTQVRRLVLVGSEDEIDAELWTQREIDVTQLEFERAPDEGGVPGTFAVFDAVAASGGPSPDELVNLTRYPRVWPVPQVERGQTFWYRVAWNEGASRFQSPAARFRSPVGTSAATIEVTIVHDAYDHDIDAWLEPAVTGASAQGWPSYPLPPTSEAVASEWVDGTSATGTQSWTFRVELPEEAAPYLPPDPGAPWVLRVTDGGYLNRSGRIQSFRITWHGPSGDEEYVGGPTPSPTLEGGTVRAYAPQGSLGVGPGSVSAAYRIGPNPAISGSMVNLSAPQGAGDEVAIYDVTGRRVSGIRLAASADGARSARWPARSGSGEPLPAGLYLARFATGVTVRVVVLPR